MTARPTLSLARVVLPALVLLASLAAGCGGPPFFAEVQDPRVCVTIPTQQVQGAPAGLGEQTVQLQGDLDLGSGLPGVDQGGLTGEVVMVDLSVTSATDLSGVSRATLTVLDPGLDGASPATLQEASYAQAPGSDPHQLSFTVATPAVNLLPALTARSGTLRYAVSFTGTPPTSSWSTDVTACVKVAVKADLTKM